ARRRSGGTRTAGSPRPGHGSASPAPVAGLLVARPGTRSPTSPARGSGSPLARSTPLPARRLPTTGCWCPGRTIFFARGRQDPLRQHRVGEHLLALRVFPFPCLQPLGRVQIHLAKLLPPTVGG